MTVGEYRRGGKYLTNIVVNSFPYRNRIAGIQAMNSMRHQLSHERILTKLFPGRPLSGPPLSTVD